MKPSNRIEYRERRHKRLRKKVQGTAERPRLCVAVSNKRMYVQFVDDLAGRTLAALCTANIETGGKNNVATATALGRKAAEQALGKGIKEAVFDRGGHAYKGRVKALAEAARAAGIKL